MLATAAAWSPDPKNPPLYLDLPTKDGQPQPDVLAKWTANAPLAFIDQYIDNLREYHGISIDVGDQDGLRVDTAKLHDVLDKYGIANSFEVYEGTHTSKVADRIQNHVIPFFSQNLCFQAALPVAVVPIDTSVAKKVRTKCIRALDGTSCWPLLLLSTSGFAQQSNSCASLVTFKAAGRRNFKGCADCCRNHGAESVGAGSQRADPCILPGRGRDQSPYRSRRRGIWDPVCSCHA